MPQIGQGLSGLAEAEVNFRLPGSCLQIAIGTHRLGVAQIVAQMASAGALTLDEAIAKTGMVPKLVQLCFAHQGNNALHSTVGSLLRQV